MNAPIKIRQPSREAGTALARLFRFSDRAAGMTPSAVREILKVTETPDVISFAGGLPAPELFPIEEVGRAAQAILREEGQAALQYGISEGYPPLREWVGGHLGRTVGMKADAAQILITAGSQQALDLIAKVLVNPGDIILVENPAYLGALQAFRAYQARIVALASDEQGIRTDRLDKFLRESPARRRPKFLYLVTNFQNPTGITTSAQRRREVVALAAEFGLPVLEDDPYGRLRYSGDEAPALAATPGARGCLYLGTSSKILAPGLRVAWLVVSDSELYQKLLFAKQASDLHTSSFCQRLVWRFLQAPGALQAHLDRLRTAYANRRDAMLAALERHLPAGCSWTRPEGGLFLWVRLPRSIDASQILNAAAAEKVAFVPGAPFWVGRPDHSTLRLNFSNASEEKINLGIQRLGRVIARALSHQPPSRPTSASSIAPPH